MGKKNIILVAVVLIVIAGASFISKTYNSPENKVERLEQQLESGKEASGYNACITKVKAERQKYTDCVTKKLEEQGYTDGIDCIGSLDNPICNTERYNAQIYAGNDCAVELDMEQLTMTEMDCAKLID